MKNIRKAWLKKIVLLAASCCYVTAPDVTFKTEKRRKLWVKDG